MPSSVLRSGRAVQVTEIMGAFVRLRRFRASHPEHARRLDDLEQRYDGQFALVFDAYQGTEYAYSFAWAPLRLPAAAQPAPRNNDT